MRFSLSNWFKFTFYFGLLLSIVLQGQIFLDHTPTCTLFKMMMFDKPVVDFKRAQKWAIDKTGKLAPAGYDIQLFYADREIL